MKTGKLTSVKNKDRQGNESSHYLATNLEFPRGKIRPVLFVREELDRPLARALQKTKVSIKLP